MKKNKTELGYYYKTFYVFLKRTYKNIPHIKIYIIKKQQTIGIVTHDGG